MKIAVTATGPSLDAQVDPRFGRCACFLVVETDDLSYEAVENRNTTLGGGAGIQSAQLVAEKGVKQVLTGNCGPNAHRTLAAADIGVIVGCSGTVRDVLTQFRAGKLAAVAEPNVASHFGTGAAPANPVANAGLPAGSGMGRGGGMGKGGGGSGMGMGRAGGRQS